VLRFGEIDVPFGLWQVLVYVVVLQDIGIMSFFCLCAICVSGNIVFVLVFLPFVAMSTIIENSLSRVFTLCFDFIKAALAIFGLCMDSNFCVVAVLMRNCSFFGTSSNENSFVLRNRVVIACCSCFAYFASFF